MIRPKPEVVKKNNIWGFNSFLTSKKKRKRYIIGQSTAVIKDIFVNLQLDSEHVIQFELEATKKDAVWGFSSFLANKKKKGKKNATKVVKNKPNIKELVPPPLKLALLADNNWGTLMMPDKKK